MLSICIQQHQPLRHSSSSKQPYGAPYTNSITFKPVKPEGGLGFPARPDMFRFEFRCPDMKQGHADFFSRDSIAEAQARVQEATGAKSVQFIRNGVPITAEEAETRRIVDLFDSAVEIRLDGLRYNVNEGLLLKPSGAAAKRTLAISYAYTLIGGSAVLAGCFWFWNRVLGKEHNKLKQIMDR